MKPTYFLMAAGLLTAPLAQAQHRSVAQLDAKYLNWHTRDLDKAQLLGTNVEKTYRELLANRKPKKTVVVAVLDSGIDIDHEDLKGKIWVNEDEIPNNQIDDDKNGYVDDVHGWNFLGNKNGQNVHFENLEYTRIYRTGSQDPLYAKAKKLYEAEVAKRKAEKENLERFENIYTKAKAIIRDKAGIEANTLEDLNKVSSRDEQVLAAVGFLKPRYEQGFNEATLQRIKKNNQDYLEKHLNLDFNPRTLVGDNPATLDDTRYGNPDVKGPRFDHGTSVAGLIAANRQNNLGIDGIAANVRIMVLRTTPHGDERDKDVALAIRYAVENGADIINMSFGKDLSPQKHLVDDAVKLAEKKNVLMVKSAGNSGRNLDEEESYPNDRYLDGTEPKNWITVGSSGMEPGERAASAFSNYSQQHVDIFAPGENIISTDSSSTYSMNDGTSLSGPVVAGIAALILSYHPDLTPPQLIRLLRDSAFKDFPGKVLAPNPVSKDRKPVKFSSLSTSGGIVNAYEAMKMADSRGK